MKRNIAGILKEYSSRVKSPFRIHDISSIMDISKDENGRTDVYDLISNSLKVGYIVGYKAAKRELKKAAASE